MSNYLEKAINNVYENLEFVSNHKQINLSLCEYNLRQQIKEIVIDMLDSKKIQDLIVFIIRFDSIFNQNFSLIERDRLIENTLKNYIAEYLNYKGCRDLEKIFLRNWKRHPLYEFNYIMDKIYKYIDARREVQDKFSEKKTKDDSS